MINFMHPLNRSRKIVLILTVQHSYIIFKNCWAWIMPMAKLS
jgi:hypothetical protein